MTLSLFQKYELRKTRFAPGAIWRDKGRHIVRKLQIIDPSEIDAESYVRELYSAQRDVIFRILDSSDYYGGSLAIGAFASWSEQYMEEHYEVVIDE